MSKENNEDHHHSDINWDEVLILPMEEIRLPALDKRNGWILDIGAGGEGIIGLLGGARVVGIDRNRAELEETSNDSLRIAMDATDLGFLNNTFETATSFFSLMYMSLETVDDVLKEVARVLKPNGELYIWDAIVEVPPKTDKKLFLVQVSVTFPDGGTIEGRYGFTLRDQGLETFKEIASRHGFVIVNEEVMEHSFFLKLSLG
ncbi:MAG: class I SAM-dependent methyltransferase [Candidatus Thorarchaeota archaeon]